MLQQLCIIIYIWLRIRERNWQREGESGNEGEAAGIRKMKQSFEILELI